MNKIWSKIKLHQKRQLSIMLVGLDYSGKTTLLNQLIEDRNSSNSVEQSRSNNSESIRSTIHSTISYHFEVTRYKDSQILVVDFSGESRYRNLWCEYYNSVDAIIFVIDSKDSFRLVVVKDELELLLSHESFVNLGLDKPNSNNTIDEGVTHQQRSLVIKDRRLIKHVSSSYDGQKQRKADNKKTLGLIRKQVPILFAANKVDQTGHMSPKSISAILELERINFHKHPWHIEAMSAKNGQGVLAGMDWLMSQLDAQLELSRRN